MTGHRSYRGRRNDSTKGYTIDAKEFENMAAMRRSFQATTPSTAAGNFAGGASNKLKKMSSTLEMMSGRYKKQSKNN